MLDIKPALLSAGGFALKNPLAIAQLAQHALKLQMAVPLDALRWAIRNFPMGKKAPQDITIGAQPPAIKLGATLRLMGTTIRASAAVAFEEIALSDTEMRIALKLSDVDLELRGESESPIAALLKSGALDLSKPGNLVNFMPKKPAAIVSAEDDRIVLDLMRVDKIANNPTLRRVLEAVTPIFNLVTLRTKDDMLVLGFRATPGGLPQTISAVAG
jgi:hypothetical protein